MNKKKLFKNIGYGLLASSFICTTIATIYAGEYINRNILSIKSINQLELNQSSNSEIYADDEKTLVWTDATYQHRPNTKENTPDVLINMLIATEDNTFYKNKGYSVVAITNTILTT